MPGARCRCRRRRRRTSSRWSASSSRAPVRCAVRSTRATAAPPTTSSAPLTGAPVERRADASPTRSTPSARAPRCGRSKTQGTLLSELVAKASNDANRDPQIGRTLFNLLVPVEMEPFLGGTSEMLIELDGGTAAMPVGSCSTPTSSELTGSDPRPWAIRSKLLRKLRTEDFRAQVVGRRRRRQHPGDRRADARPSDVPAAAGRARRGDRGRGAAHHRARRRRRRRACAR